MSKTSIVAALLLLAGPAALAAQELAPGYAPGTTRYRVHSTAQASQEVMGQKQSFEFTSNHFLSIALTRKAQDTLGFTITIDSSAMSSNMPMPLPDVAKLKGLSFTGTMTPQGKLIQVTPPADIDPDLAQVVDGMSHLLPLLPAHATIGKSWSDTTRESVDRPETKLSTTVITKSVVAGDTSVIGQSGWKIDRTGTITMGGTAEQQGQQLSIDGNGTLQGTFVLGKNGSYLGSHSTQQVQRTVKAGTMTVPTTQTVETTVEPIGKGR